MGHERIRKNKECEKCKKIKNTVNAKILEINESYWEAFIANMEHNLYEAKKYIWYL